jgi:hypothetical protein
MIYAAVKIKSGDAAEGDEKEVSDIRKVGRTGGG